MFLASCVPSDNETELNDISIFCVPSDSFSPLERKKEREKRRKKERPGTPPIELVIQRFPLGLGDKVVVGKVLGRNKRRFHAAPL